MKIKLAEQSKKELELRHRVERDGRVRDRIKAVLLKSEGWTNAMIGQALRIHVDTVGQHLQDWQREEKLKPENGGSQSKLDEQQTQQLVQHIQAMLYTKVYDICVYVAKTFEIQYTVSGMTKWLKEQGFSHKQPKMIPAKADAGQQEAFIGAYLNLVADTPQDEPILFMDAVHPTMATKISHGWIKKGQEKPIATTASRTRVNIIGAIELNTMNVISDVDVETVNALSVLALFDKIKQHYPNAAKIHLILDQAGYHRSHTLQEGAKSLNIELHFLPAYSPNLNPIERLWKVMNEAVRNNVFFDSAKAFRQALNHFFTDLIPAMKDALLSRITDNFQTFNTVSSG
jgi:transposase